MTKIRSTPDIQNVPSPTVYRDGNDQVDLNSFEDSTTVNKPKPQKPVGTRGHYTLRSGNHVSNLPFNLTLLTIDLQREICEILDIKTCNKILHRARSDRTEASLASSFTERVSREGQRYGLARVVQQDWI